MGDSKDSDQLTLLMHYTSSHMMMFIGLIAAVVSASKYLNNPSKLFTLAGISFLIAGCATGIIASYIPHSKNYDEFIKRDLVVLKIPFKFKPLEKTENYGFWIGIVLAIAGYILSNG